MGSRDKDTKSLQDKLKVLFKKGASAPMPARNELVISSELERELGPETPLPRRLRALKDVGDKALSIRIQDGGVERLWTCTLDLLSDPNTEARHAALSFLRVVAEGQAEYLLIMRTILFHFLRDTHNTHLPEDSQLRFKLLYTLTNSGKNIACFEEQIGAFLLEWLPQVSSPALLVDLLQLIINVVKFNATYLDEDIVHGIVNNACHLCEYSVERGVVTLCLSLLEAVVSYSLLPRAALGVFVAALCRTVSVDHYCRHSWKVMRYVVGADMGHAALQELVDVLRGRGGTADAGLARGAVFYIHMALWGPRRVPTLQVSYLAVLPAFLKVVRGGVGVVVYEALVALAALVARAPDLHAAAWDLIILILHTILKQESGENGNELVKSRAHALISSIEQLEAAGLFQGDTAALLQLIDVAGHDRPEASTIRLISRLGAEIGPGAGDWLRAAELLADKYLRHDARLNVRLHTLHVIHDIIKRNRYLYEEEVVVRLGAGVVGLATGAAGAAGVAVRAAGAAVLAELAAAAPGDACADLADILQQILNRPFEIFVSEVPLGADADVSDLVAARAGLAHVFHASVRRGAGLQAARALLVLLDHLDRHYRRPNTLRHHPDIRLQIFELLFCLRANAYNFVGCCYDASGQAVYGERAARLRPTVTPALLVEPLVTRHQRPKQRDHPPGAVVVPAGRVARALCAALVGERDWAVLGAVLRALPHLLAARCLLVGRKPQDLDMLASTLCSMVTDRSLQQAEWAGQALLGSELAAAVLPALASLAVYHALLEPPTLQRIVRCLLKYGMVGRTPGAYISALCVFSLECRDTTVRMLPEILLDLSKISDTKAIASPMLEFLSTLTRLPRVFASFVEDQYMSVFAILLPYTNPSRYSHYVVSLAHHVIASWFLKCRLSYRRNFVKFIIHGLHNYIIMPFEEQLQATPPPTNEDSSNRKRSSSLGSRSGAPRASGRGAAPPPPASAPAAFHVELTETCVDLLARYTFTPCSVKPHRSDTAEFLFSGGVSTTWLVGHKLVTITTSGCHQNTLKNGLCDRCASLCKQHAESVCSPLPAPPPAASPPQLQVNDTTATPTQLNPEIKRYSKYSLQHSRSTDTSSSLSDFQPSSRQNSSENKSSDPFNDAELEEGGWSRVERVVAAGGCACWCGAWAEVHVRSPTGDVAWIMRMQNTMNWDSLLESPLQAVLAMLDPGSGGGGAAGEARGAAPGGGAGGRSAAAAGGVSAESCAPAASEGLTAAKADLHRTVDTGGRAGGAAAAGGRPQRAVSTDSLVINEKEKEIESTRPPPSVPQNIPAPVSRSSTQPINIPGSPTRHTPSGSSTTDDIDLMMLMPQGKSRQPVRRSNSSPEMSSSWKLEPDLILLPPCPPTPSSLHASKKGSKKPEQRVSCEAIPEEVCGSSPHHHLLATYNSDPGTGSATETEKPEQDSNTPHHQLQKTASEGAVVAEGAGAGGGAAGEDLPPLSRSKRSNTISVMTSSHRLRDSVATRAAGGGAGSGGGGVTPSFLLLQLYHNMSTYPITPAVPGEAAHALDPLSERPLKISGVQHERTIKNLDLVPPLETYKVGVLYVGPGQQDDEVAILKNEYGSVRYQEFLSQLGTLVSLERGAETPPHLFLNLETGGKDGQYTYVWHTDIMQVLFHVATAMPSTAKDPNGNEKRKYIGNDFVSIVYNDSGEDFNIHTIKGQFNVCIVVVEPLELGCSRVVVKCKDARLLSSYLSHLAPVLLSDSNVPLFARQQALHLSLATHIHQSLSQGAGHVYASNALERLRHIKRLRRRLQDQRLAADNHKPKPYSHRQDLAKRIAMDDFNDYT